MPAAVTDSVAGFLRVVAALAVTFSYTPTGGQPQLYTTAPLIVTQHAENAVPVEKKEGTAGIHVAEVAGSGGSSQSYTTLAEAFTAVKDESTTEARTIGLLANTTLNEQVEIASLSCSTCITLA